MTRQLSIDFSVVHQKENNPDSQSYLDLNRDKFNLCCWKVLIRLLAGERLTVAGTAQLGENHISSLPRRVGDLEKLRIPIEKEWILNDEGKRSHKVYFIKEEHRIRIANKIIDKTKIN